MICVSIEPGAATTCGVPVDLRRIAAPVYLYASREDHIVPWPAAYASTALLKGKRVGLITNHTGQDRNRNATIDLLKNAPGVALVKLFKVLNRHPELFDEIAEAGDRATAGTATRIAASKRKRRAPARS